MSCLAEALWHEMGTLIDCGEAYKLNHWGGMLMPPSPLEFTHQTFYISALHFLLLV